jgi:EKC/KEOPS complex subunit CGI121/TPRKB
VQGTLFDLTDANLAVSTDWAKVRKYYKLTGLEDSNDEEQRVRQMALFAIGSMALRGL